MQNKEIILKPSIFVVTPDKRFTFPEDFTTFTNNSFLRKPSKPFLFTNTTIYIVFALFYMYVSSPSHIHTQIKTNIKNVIFF